MNDNSNFLMAIALSLCILAGFHWFYEVPKQKALQAQASANAAITPSASAKPAEDKTTSQRPRADVLKDTARLTISNSKIHGSLNMKGGRFDDITLVRYRETVKPDSPDIILLSPAGSAAPHQASYAEFGWLAADPTLKLPGAETLWTSENSLIEPGKTAKLRWDNGASLVFERTIALDEDYMFTITDTVKNNRAADTALIPFALISRHGTPHTMGYAVLHEGPLGVFNHQLKEANYKKLHDTPMESFESQGGWLGMTDAYWLTSLIPPQDEKISARFLRTVLNEQERYQTDMQLSPVTVNAGASISKTFRLFVGAKEVSLLDRYGAELKLPMFDKAVDFGWFYFIAKPFFQLLETLYHLMGNYGLAIIVFTVLLRLAFFPLSESSYRSMAKMKELQPEMQKLKERYPQDPLKMNEELTALYKREKLNPLGGCLPVLIQIPVFFALYKVLLVSIEMRHAPFYGWVHDLSAPDPSNLFTLFGLLPFTAPDWLHLGAWPLLMGLTMYIQQKLSPPPPDKMTAQIFTFMPIMFTFLLAKMSAGLVIYWTLSNILAIAQQKLINHKIEKGKKAS